MNEHDATVVENVRAYMQNFVELAVTSPISTRE